MLLPCYKSFVVFWINVVDMSWDIIVIVQDVNWSQIESQVVVGVGGVGVQGI